MTLREDLNFVYSKFFPVNRLQSLEILMDLKAKICLSFVLFRIRMKFVRSSVLGHIDSSLRWRKHISVRGQYTCITINGVVSQKPCRGRENLSFRIRHNCSSSNDVSRHTHHG
jgi:hypothetical protein